MTHRKKKKGQTGSAPDGDASRKSDAEVRAGAWKETGKKVRREFPGVVERNVPLRVAIDPEAHSAMHLHANEDLGREVCGVLVGDVCEDDSGSFVHVRAIVRGTSAQAGAAHVTYTQETWEQIHREMEAEHRGRRMLGWYHTHPGFGVTFSDMDTFIHRNFFSGETQIAVVLDPLGGEMAVGTNRGDELVYVSRVWVGGRERVCLEPGTTPEHAGTTAEAAPSAELEQMRQHLARIHETLDEQRGASRRLATGILFLALVGVCAWIVLNVFGSMRSPQVRPPKLRSYVPVPVRIGDKTAFIGLQVVDWQIPDELNALLLEQTKQEKQKASDAPPPAEGSPKGRPGDGKPGTEPGAKPGDEPEEKPDGK